MASVTPAMKRLMNMGLVDYTARAYVDLTKEGMRIARKIAARHELIRRFLVEVLGVSEANAVADACSAEHIFSDETIDQMVRFFEYIQRCDDTDTAFLQRFKSCSMVNPGKHPDACSCSSRQREERMQHMAPTRPLSGLVPGETAEVVQVTADTETRRSLINRGIISGRSITLLHMESGDAPYGVQVGTDTISLTKTEADGVVVSG